MHIKDDKSIDLDACALQKTAFYEKSQEQSLLPRKEYPGNNSSLMLSIRTVSNGISFRAQKVSTNEVGIFRICGFD